MSAERNPLSAKKSMTVNSPSDLRAKVADVEVVGDPNLWVLIGKASSQKEGWMKSTKAMTVPGGVLIQTCTQQGENISEALVFLPNVCISETAPFELQAMPLPPALTAPIPVVVQPTSLGQPFVIPVTNEPVDPRAVATLDCGCGEQLLYASEPSGQRPG